MTSSARQAGAVHKVTITNGTSSLNELPKAGGVTADRSAREVKEPAQTCTVFSSWNWDEKFSHEAYAFSTVWDGVSLFHLIIRWI